MSRIKPHEWQYARQSTPDEIKLADNIATAFRDGPGFAVDICHDGEEAMLMCKATEYDLIVLDDYMTKL